MKNFARIENSKVVERIDADDLPPFHPSLLWVECPAGTQVGWRCDGKSFSAHIGNLPEIKAAKWESIKAERSRLKAGGVKVGEYWFHTDDASRIQYGILDGKATRAALPGNAILHPEWKSMSGVKTPMTVALLRQVIDAGIASEAAIFDAAETHKAAMEASADPAAYDFSAGWPAVYVPVIK